jgi:hypothetical protein
VRRGLVEASHRMAERAMKYGSSIYSSVLCLLLFTHTSIQQSNLWSGSLNFLCMVAGSLEKPFCSSCSCPYQQYSLYRRWESAGSKRKL